MKTDQIQIDTTNIDTYSCFSQIEFSDRIQIWTNSDVFNIDIHYIWILEI
jgi:hypothetical protein